MDDTRLEALQRAALAVSSARGDAIFQELTRYLAAILDSELALVGELVGTDPADPQAIVRTLGVWGVEGYGENFQYPLHVTPCRDVIGKSFHAVRIGVTARYPEDAPLVRLGAVGYAGYPLKSAAGRPLGVLAVVSKKPLSNTALIESVMKIFAVRAEAELERRAHEQALAGSAEQYRAIFNATADSMVLRDADFRVVDVNPAYEAMSGRKREEVLGKDVLTMSRQALNEHVRGLHRRALAGESVIFDSRAKRKNGEQFHIETRGVPILHQGRPHVLYVGRDITARKNVERELRASEEQYRAIFNAATDALVLRDAEARVVDVNPAFLEISGYTREEVISGNRWIFAGPEQSALAKEMHSRVIAGESLQFEVSGERKDGTRLEVEMRAVPIQYRGQPHALGMARDITGRKRAEAERAALEEQLRQAQKMEALGHLTGGIAHDFNNLLASIMGYITLAAEREAAAEPRTAHFLEQALAASRRARDLIQQMLTFSRGRRGAPRALDLGGAVGGALSLVRGSLPATLEMHTDLARGLPPVMLDPVQLDQVLLNLSINARDAMAGAGRLEVAVRRAEAMRAVCASCRQPFSGDFVELAVSDTGPGIPPPVLARMFEPFFSTKQAGRGSGMGLATVHGIVHEHDGHILVDSGAGGSRFRILLPALDGATAASLPRAGQPAGKARAPLRGRILVVDDEPSVRGFMREMLQGWGLDTTIAASPAEALAAFDADPARWDVVITDQTMPGMTGLALARELLARRPGLPVILYSGHLDPVAQRELESAGVRELLAKPVEPALLHILLKRHLS